MKPGEPELDRTRFVEIEHVEGFRFNIEFGLHTSGEPA